MVKAVCAAASVALTWERELHFQGSSNRTYICHGFRRQSHTILRHCFGGERARCTNVLFVL